MKTLILSGHPRAKSFTLALADAYRKGSEQAGAQTSLISLADLNIGKVSASELPSKAEWTTDVTSLWQAMLNADHIVITHPLWWGSMPGELKALFDRLLVSGEAYKYEKGKAFPTGLLAGRTAEVIMTSDTPDWYYRLGYHSAQTNLMKNQILKFIGLKPIRNTHISPVRLMSETDLAKKLNQVRKMAFQHASSQLKSAA